MKIGILTHQLGTNYGGILQNFALQTVLKRHGYEPQTLNYTERVPVYIKLLSFISRLLKRIRGVNIPLRGWATNNEIEYITRNTQEFVSNHIETTEKIDLSKICKIDKNNYDAIIVGSDQVWRYRKNILHFYLSDFKDVPKVKIAYAASFGLDKWNYPESITTECKRLIKCFTSISVREISGVHLCREHLGANPSLVLDPTLLLVKSDFLSLIKGKTKCKASGKRLTAYILDDSAMKREIIEKVAEKKKLIIHTVMAKKKFGDVNSFNLEDCVFPKIESWLEGFANSEFVVTDSFHGTVFAIIFNKPFVAIANDIRGTSRFDSILGILKLKDRLISKNEEIEKIIESRINWDEVNSTIKHYRDFSISFLLKSLQSNYE